MVAGCIRGSYPRHSPPNTPQVWRAPYHGHASKYLTLLRPYVSFETATCPLFRVVRKKPDGASPSPRHNTGHQQSGSFLGSRELLSLWRHDIIPLKMLSYLPSIFSYGTSLVLQGNVSRHRFCSSSGAPLCDISWVLNIGTAPCRPRH